MQTMPSPGSQRGAIRPPERDERLFERPAARPPVRRPGSMDGVVKVPKPDTDTSTPASSPAIAPTPSTAPIVQKAAPAAPPEKNEAPSLETELEAELAKQGEEKLDRKAKRALKRAKKNGNQQGTMGSGRRYDRKKALFILLAIIALLIAGYIAYDTWMTNSKAETALSQPNISTNPSEWSKEDEGQDETDPQVDSLENYVVEASLPRALYIDKLNVAARIMPMSVNTDDSIQAPKNIFDAGWYNASVKPGETGAVFIDGHASGPTRQGLFAYLDTLKVGDELQVEKGDGERLTYRVVHTETVPLGEVDMRKVLLPHGTVSKGLNLMTCTGEWLPLEKTYDKRVIVYTEQV